MDVDTFRDELNKVEVKLDDGLDEMMVLAVKAEGTKEIRLELRSRIKELKTAMDKMLFELHRDV